MTLVGGLGTIIGPILGALVLISMETYMPGLQDMVTVAQGAVVVVVVLAFRAGIVGRLSGIWRKLAAGLLPRLLSIREKVEFNGCCQKAAIGHF
jgi:branched-chain amino acid transport system permease protein